LSTEFLQGVPGLFCSPVPKFKNTFSYSKPNSARRWATLHPFGPLSWVNKVKSLSLRTVVILSPVDAILGRIKMPLSSAWLYTSPFRRFLSRSAENIGAEDEKNSPAGDIRRNSFLGSLGSRSFTAASVSLYEPFCTRR
jgi:hypothetical protein